MQNFEARIWEKAEHWYFHETLKASDLASAWKQFQKDYPKRSYSISDVRPVYTPKEVYP